MKSQLKIVLAAVLAALTVGCVAMEDRPREVITASGVQQDTYIPHGTAPYYGIDPYGNSRSFGTVSPE